MDIVESLHSLHPMETMFDKNNLTLSSNVSMTNQALLHFTSLMATIEDGDENIRFEM